MSTLTLPAIVPETNDTFPSGLHKYKGIEVIDWEKLLKDNEVLNSFLLHLIPPGSIHAYGAENAPDGYLLCDGREVSRTEYARLFAVIDTVYGSGDGSSTFNVPDMRNRFPLGYDANLGAVGGSASHTLSLGEIPSHEHKGMTWSSTNLSLNTPGASYHIPYDRTGSDTSSNFRTGLSGSGAAHNNLPPYLGLAYIMKT